jgi:hypothetical protein
VVEAPHAGGPDALSGRPAAWRAGRASGADQVEQVRPLGVVELQGLRDGVDDALGDAVALPRPSARVDTIQLPSTSSFGWQR